MLEKQDLQQIEQIVTAVVDKRVGEAEDRIVSRINREITDLAEINRAVIAKVSMIPDLQQRLTVIEQKLGIA